MHSLENLNWWVRLISDWKSAQWNNPSSTANCCLMLYQNVCG